MQFCSSGIKLALKGPTAGPTTEGYFLKNLSIAGREIFFLKKRVVGLFGVRNADIERFSYLSIETVKKCFPSKFYVLFIALYQAIINK